MIINDWFLVSWEIQFCEMLEFTTKTIKPAVIENSLNYLKCKKQKYY